MIRESHNVLFDKALTTDYVAGSELALGTAYTTGEAGHWIGESFGPMAGKNCKLVVYLTALTTAKDIFVKVETKQTPATFVKVDSSSAPTNSALSAYHQIAEYKIPKEKLVVNGAPVAEFVLGDDVENFIKVSAKGDTGVNESIRVEFVPYV